jgi:hypothetical protein
MTRKGNMGAWVSIRWDGTPRGTLVCPHHGALPPATEYTPGRAPCGCDFVLLQGGVLRAVAASPGARKAQPGEAELAAKRQAASLTNTPDTGARDALATGASCAPG